MPLHGLADGRQAVAVRQPPDVKQLAEAGGGGGLAAAERDEFGEDEGIAWLEVQYAGVSGVDRAAELGPPDRAEQAEEEGAASCG